MSQKVPKTAEATRDGVKIHNITISINVNTENFDALKTLRINRSQPYNLATYALGDSLVTSSDTHHM